MQLIHKGKVKDVYRFDEKCYLFHFSNRISAFDVQMKTPISGKGNILCKFAEFWFKYLKFKNHMVEVVDEDKMLVKKLEIIPVECVVRGYLYGSLYERYKKGLVPNLSVGLDLSLASRLREPIFDPTTKSDTHDRPITETEILSRQIVSEQELESIKKASLCLYSMMANLAENAGFIMADVKFEFGKDPSTRQIMLGDSIGPDEFRLWEKSKYAEGKMQESYDKQYLRDWLTEIGFKENVERLTGLGTKPEPPELPVEVVDEILRRYKYAYSVLSNKA
jgi:phosphoribosylaminoimidazole-succinocarboxamide synthase